MENDYQRKAAELDEDIKRREKIMCSDTLNFENFEHFNFKNQPQITFLDNESNALRLKLEKDREVATQQQKKFQKILQILKLYKFFRIFRILIILIKFEELKCQHTIDITKK